jgi:carbonic anhydrase
LNARSYFFNNTDGGETVIKRLTSILHHLQNLKACSTQNHFEKVYVDVDQLLPSVKTTYCYDGSLTTPPCSEGVKWIILTAPIQLSNQQISAFQKIIHHDNRPVQRLNEREVVTDSLTVK